MSNRQETPTNDLAPVFNTLPTLVMFCKRPKLNQGKQRLVEMISAENALIIAQGLLACAVEDIQVWDGPVVIACSDEADMQWAQMLNENAQVVTQLPAGVSGNLGQRLNHVDHELRAQGHQHIVIIGTDAPVLNSLHYQDVKVALSEYDVVLSHAEDGGVVVMANSVPWPDISALPWSTEYLSQALAQACRHEKLSVHYSMPGYDIDYVADIQKLKRDLINDHRPARQALLITINQLFASLGGVCHA